MPRATWARCIRDGGWFDISYLLRNETGRLKTTVNSKAIDRGQRFNSNAKTHLGKHKLLTAFAFYSKLLVCRKRLDLGFLVDGSGSIEAYGRGNFRRCLRFVKQVVASFHISPRQTRVGIVLFSSRTNLVFGFNRYRDKRSILKAIDSIRYPRGGTYIGRALRFSRQRLFSTGSKARKVSVPQNIFVFFLSIAL